MGKRKTTEQFIEESRTIHNDKYDYSLVEYKNSYTKVNIVCHIHGTFYQTPTIHIFGKGGCPLCGQLKQRQTCLLKYGFENPRKSIVVKNKIKQTMLNNHGVEYAQQSSKIRNKKTQTNLNRYGVEYPQKLPKMVERKKLTCIEKYGVENPQQNKEIQNNTKRTNLERYGFENAFQNQEIQDKQKQTNLEKYGVENSWLLPEIREKIKQTNLERYGVEYHNQTHMVDILPLINDKDWLKQQYKNKTAYQIADELGLDGTTIGNYLRKHEIEIKQLVRYSYKCISWLESIMEQKGIHIQHALNGGEYQIPNTRYSADGYCTETNTIYEFHGDYWHGNPVLYESEIINEINGKSMGELYQKTIEREEEIRSMGYKLVIVWEYNLSQLT